MKPYEGQRDVELGHCLQVSLMAESDASSPHGRRKGQTLQAVLCSIGKMHVHRHSMKVF